MDNNKKLIFIKTLCVCIMVFFAIIVYPCQILSIANVNYAIDKNEYWDSIEILKLDEQIPVIMNYHTNRVQKIEDLKFVFCEVTENSELCIALKDENSNTIKQVNVEVGQDNNNDKTTIDFKTEKLSADKDYIIELSALKGNVGLYKIDRAAMPFVSLLDGEMEVDEKNAIMEIDTKEYATKDLGIYSLIVCVFVIILFFVPWKKIGYFYLRVSILFTAVVFFLILNYYERVAELLKGYESLRKIYILICIFAVGAVVFHALVERLFEKNKFENFFIVSAICWGMVYLLIMPPYSYPDEPTHYAQANLFANKIMGVSEKDDNKQIYIRNEELIDIVNFPNEDSLYNYYDGCFSRKSEDNSYGTMGVVNGKGINRASAIAYLPFIIGIMISRILKLNYVWSFTLSNLLGLMFYTFMMYMSIKILPFGKKSLALVAQFPLALSMATSFTYDIVNFSLITFLFCYYCKLDFQDAKVKIKDIAFFVICSILVMPIKYAYLPFVFLILLIPNSKFEVRKVKLIKCAVIVLCILFVFKDNVVVSHLSNNKKVSQKKIEEEFNVSMLYKNTNASMQSISELTADKTDIITYGYNTVYRHMDYFINGLIGMKIGWGDTFIPDYIYNLWWIVLLLSLLDNRDGSINIKNRKRIMICLITFISFGAVCCAMFAFATPRGYTDCPSIAPRYLLPLLLPLCIGLKGKINIKEKISDEVYIWTSDICQVIGVIYMLNGYLQR